MSIVTVPAEVLTKPAAEVIDFDAVQQLIDRLYKAMYACTDPEAVGLAAPQIGESWQVFTYDDRAGHKGEVINPMIEGSWGKVTELEGCMSRPKHYVPVQRPRGIRWWGFDRKGREIGGVAEGFLARILCHETDHLQGILIPGGAE